ncbi:hypothetical protein RND81_01G157800 [Saponaria officinalis]|uniref:Peptidase A1 domain-containing protein n=1 Tax=Saponaria officinalis TaxID=3572 RepID=A0AAW1NJ22_SAPOF
MAIHTMIKAISIVLKIFTFLLSVTSFHTKIPNGLTLKMIHRDSPDSPIYRANMTDKERMEDYIKMSNAKVKFLRMSIASNNKSSIYVNPNRATIRPSMIEQHHSYMVQVGIGTFENENPTSKFYYLYLDTASDIIWTQCEAARNKHFHQIDPLFPASRSSTYRPFSCISCPPVSKYEDNVCIMKSNYEDGSQLSSIIAVEVFTFATEGGHSRFIPDIIFGCGIDMQNFKEDDYLDNKISGIIGMGYGFYGFMEQTQMIFWGIFSYCLQPIKTRYSSPMSTMYFRLGKDILPGPVTGLMSTPIFRYKDFNQYYLTLEDISVDSRKLNMQPYFFTIKDNGSGGFIIDSGATLTYIIKGAYLIFKRAVRDFITLNNNNVREMRKPELRYDLCYRRYKNPKIVNIPTVTFHFSNNANYVIPTTDTFFVTTSEDRKDMYCMNFFENHEMSYLGVFHQANKRIIYDTRNSWLFFTPTDCSQEN